MAAWASRCMAFRLYSDCGSTRIKPISGTFPASETALMLARKHIRETGILVAETAVPGEAYIRSLRSRGLIIRETNLVVHEGDED